MDVAEVRRRVKEIVFKTGELTVGEMISRQAIMAAQGTKTEVSIAEMLALVVSRIDRERSGTAARTLVASDFNGLLLSELGELLARAAAAIGAVQPPPPIGATPSIN